MTEPGAPTPSQPPRGAFSRLRRRLIDSQDVVEAARLRDDAVVSGAVCIADVVPGEKVVVHGRLRSVTLRPRSGVPAVEAEVYDGTGRLTLVWLGRRRIRGIEPGRTVQVEGRVTCHTDEPLMFNPRYALSPKVGE